MTQDTRQRYSMIYRFRRAAAVLMAAGCVCAVVACGSSASSKSSSSSRPSSAAGRGGFAQLTSSERSCLSKHGLNFANRSPGSSKGGRPAFPKGKRPNFKRGTPPQGSGGRGFGGARSGMSTKALQACGVKLPSGPGGGGQAGGGAGPTQTSPAS
jgi:hypothetical protein